MPLVDPIPRFGTPTVTPMANPRVYTFMEGANWYLAERIALPTSAYAVRTDVTNIDLAVYDLDIANPEAAIYSATALANTAVETALTVDGYWPFDGIGRNFLGIILASNVQAWGCHHFKVEYVLNTGSYNAIPVRFHVIVEPVTSL